MTNQQHHFNPNLAQFQMNAQNASKEKTNEKLSKQEREKTLLLQGDKHKAIQHQVKRLILLRHASKCSLGNLCTIKKCPQMVRLWNHMKVCRDQDCKTEHCLTSRCVLNHYRICKEKNNATTCKICAPVMKVIEQQDLQSANSNNHDSLFQQNGGSTNPDLNDLTPLPLEQPILNTNTSSNSKKDSEDKVFSLVQLQEEQIKLDKQRQLLNRLQEQQNLQQFNHQISHINPVSEEEKKKLQDQQQMLEQCTNKFIEDQHALNSLVNRQSHSSRVDQEKKEDAGITLDPFSSESANIQNLSQLSPFQENTTEAEPYSFPTSRKRALSDLSAPELKSQKIGNNFKSSDFDLEPLNIGQSQDTSQEDPPALKHLLVSEQLLPLVTSLIQHELAWVFSEPVDPVELNLPDYFEVIKKPMDLSKVKERLETKFYGHVDDVRNDVSLVFDNAILYNGEKSDVGQMAIKLSNIFKTAMSNTLEQSRF